MTLDMCGEHDPVTLLDLARDVGACAVEDLHELGAAAYPFLPAFLAGLGIFLAFFLTFSLAARHAARQRHDFERRAVRKRK